LNAVVDKVRSKNARLAGVFVSLVGYATLASALVLIVLLTGCAAPQTRELLQDEKLKLPPRAELTKVPFFPQDQYQCGPAALATVLQAAGRPATPAELIPLVYVPERQGSFQVEIIAAARRYHTVAVPLQPYLEDVLREVAAGSPVLVLQNLSLPFAPQWHYAVVVGYDLETAKLILRSGQYERLETNMSTFERTWARSKYWAIVAMAPERTPVTVTQSAYAEAAVALETKGYIAGARTAYQTALRRWPRNQAALIGTGNIAYRDKDLPAAERAFRRAVQLYPDSGIALNNLAQVLLEQGKLDEALQMARLAVSKGGATLGQARQTLVEIEAKRSSASAPRN
jgi:tetratricopeptide (TPR) repeat protein